MYQIKRTLARPDLEREGHFVLPPAANHQRIGKTQGRGRQERDGKKAEMVKDIYI